MKVTLVSATQFLDNAGVDWSPDPTTSGPEAACVFAGRGCYESWDRPRPETASDADYLRNIIKVGHHSILRHAMFGLRIEGVSRSLTHELVVHKHLQGHSQLSQRYVVPGVEVDWVRPPALDDSEWLFSKEQAEIALEAYGTLIRSMKSRDLIGRKAREAARSVLPSMTPTSLMVTANAQAWRSFFDVRATLHADAEIRALAVEIFRALSAHSPSLFPDYVKTHNSDTAWLGRVKL